MSQQTLGAGPETLTEWTNLHLKWEGAIDTCVSNKLETVRPYSTKPGTQEMSLMALTLYFLTQTLYTKYQIEERPPLE